MQFWLSVLGNSQSKIALCEWSEHAYSLIHTVVHVEVDGTWVGDTDGVEVTDSGSSGAGSWDGSKTVSSLYTYVVPAHIVLISQNSSLLWAVISCKHKKW